MEQRDEWESLSAPYEPIPGIGRAPGVYALYQGGVLKYIGEGDVVGHRVEQWRSGARRYFKIPSAMIGTALASSRWGPADRHAGSGRTIGSTTCARRATRKSPRPSLRGHLNWTIS